MQTKRKNINIQLFHKNINTQLMQESVKSIPGLFTAFLIGNRKYGLGNKK